MTRAYQSRYASREGRLLAARDRLIRLGEIGPEAVQGALLGRMLGTLETPGRLPHPVVDHTVILLGFPEPHEDPEHAQALRGLGDFLRERRIGRINSGWRTEGYAVTFRDASHAAAFRRQWYGDTVVPVSDRLTQALGLADLTARLADLVAA